MFNIIEGLTDWVTLNILVSKELWEIWQLEITSDKLK